MSARVVFMGTPHAALPTLEALVDRHEVGLVLTRPDKPQGRSADPVPPPVKTRAMELGLTVAQPERTRDILEHLVGHGPFAVGVVVAYGHILRPEVLELAPHGFLNIHFSLLPRWRGAAPVARALMAGDPMSGVTIMKMDEGLDTGAVLTAQAVDIAADETAGELTDRLAHLGARLLVDSLDRYLAGEMDPVPQSDEGLTHAEKLGAADRPIDPGGEVGDVINQVRALAPEPTATLRIDGEDHKIFSVRRSDNSPPPGTWQIVEGMPLVGLADGGIELVSLQPPGKTPQDGAAWARGRRRVSGTVG
ncbi:MAG TPA: methionyl-tRNA formyltransferase [Acidimicrobiia bacterium]|jgi:methionyl-tRNA formyltransferase|nr:methionyl-tRNA formyltransferase [Acidimicrobiia bacterium]